MSEPINFLIQSVENKDFLSLQKLALKYSFLNLPSAELLLKTKIKNSEDSFAEYLPIKDRNFLFVLKSLNKNQTEIIGSSQIRVRLGTVNQPHYSLKILQKNNLNQALQLKVETQGPSYLGGLILNQSYRGHPIKLGKLLSLIRFLFVSIYKDWFSDIFLAEIAPLINQKKENLFFKHFIQKFMPFSLKEIDYLTLTDKKKLFSYYPKQKFLFSELSVLVRQSFAQSAQSSQKAKGLLEKQNFCFSNEVDPFDSGPYIHAQKKQIPVIQNTQKVCVQKDVTLKSKIPKVKYLWGKMEQAKFKGGVLEGVLQKNLLYISKDYFTSRLLADNSVIFISSFD